MKVSALIVGLVGFAGGVGAVLLARVWFEKVPEDFSFVAGAILGTCAALWVQHRQGAEQPTAKDKAILGVVLAAVTLVYGIVFHVALAPFKYGLITVLVSPLVSFAFPFFLCDTYWQALNQQRQQKG